MNLPNEIFVTGSDTGVGKTVISAILTAGLNAGYWKPIQAGVDTDAAWIQKAALLPSSHFYKEAYSLKLAASPHHAAKAEGLEIDLKNIVKPKWCQSHLIVEGAGGLMVPLNDSAFVIDLISQLQIPVLIVCRSGLGTINHTLMSIQTLNNHKVPILGAVMNGPRHPSNRAAIEKYGKIPVLAEIEPLAIIDRETLIKSFQHYFK